MKKRIVLLLVAFTTTATLSACSTVSGFGKDMQRVGQSIEKEADKSKR